MKLMILPVILALAAATAAHASMTVISCTSDAATGAGSTHVMIRSTGAGFVATVATLAADTHVVSPPQSFAVTSSGGPAESATYTNASKGFTLVLSSAGSIDGVTAKLAKGTLTFGSASGLVLTCTAIDRPLE